VATLKSPAALDAGFILGETASVNCILVYADAPGTSTGVLGISHTGQVTFSFVDLGCRSLNIEVAIYALRSDEERFMRFVRDIIEGFGLKLTALV